jgi:hypothetical protein
MSKRISASICLTDISEKFRAGHSSVTTAKNGKKYINLSIWINDAPDQYGNDVSIQLNSKQDKRDAEGKVYVGNGKTADAAPVAVVVAPQIEPEPGNDLPF